MSIYLEHAKRELKIAGYKPIEELPENDPNRRMQENILELLDILAKQGHSGLSAFYIIHCFEKLAKFEPLTPLKCDEGEWNEVGNDIYQNNRLLSVFKKGKNGKPYYLDAIIWRQKMEDGVVSSFTGELKFKDGRTITSAQYIRLPFIPKSFYVDVKSIDDETYELINPKQLNKVFEYYDLFE